MPTEVRDNSILEYALRSVVCEVLGGAVYAVVGDSSYCSRSDLGYRAGAGFPCSVAQ